jgi:hypothetical protein
MTPFPVARSIRKFLVLTLTLGTVAAGTFIIEAPPVEAKRMSCLQKYRACQVRCSSNGGIGSDGWYSCHNRTCAPQFDRCG